MHLPVSWSFQTFVVVLALSCRNALCESGIPDDYSVSITYFIQHPRTALMSSAGPSVRFHDNLRNLPQDEYAITVVRIDVDGTGLKYGELQESQRDHSIVHDLYVPHERVKGWTTFLVLPGFVLRTVGSSGKEKLKLDAGLKKRFESFKLKLAFGRECYETALTPDATEWQASVLREDLLRAERRPSDAERKAWPEGRRNVYGLLSTATGDQSTYFLSDSFYRWCSFCYTQNIPSKSLRAGGVGSAERAMKDARELLAKEAARDLVSIAEISASLDQFEKKRTLKCISCDGDGISVGVIRGAQRSGIGNTGVFDAIRSVDKCSQCEGTGKCMPKSIVPKYLDTRKQLIVLQERAKVLVGALKQTGPTEDE